MSSRRYTFSRIIRLHYKKLTSCADARVPSSSLWIGIKALRILAASIVCISGSPSLLHGEQYLLEFDWFLDHINLLCHLLATLVDPWVHHGILVKATRKDKL